MKSLPTIESGSYENQQTNNDQKITALFNSLFPDSLIPYSYIFELVKYLEETRVNARVLPEVVRGIHNLIIGTGRGQVIVHVQKETMNVQTREQGDNLDTSL